MKKQPATVCKFKIGDEVVYMSPHNGSTPKATVTSVCYDEIDKVWRVSAGYVQAPEYRFRKVNS